MKRFLGGTIGLMGHVVADYPSRDDARAMIDIMVGEGAGIIEIQIPFSEPMADGPTFLVANHEALKKGVDYYKSLELLQSMAERYPQVTFVIMSYLNVIYKRNLAVFAQEAKSAGAKGVIIPDLPLEHSEKPDGELQKAGVANIRLIPPNTSAERMNALCDQAQSLIYAVARRGVTGASTTFDQDTTKFIEKIRSFSDLPIAVGFGVKSGEDIVRLKGIADYAVIGTQSLQTFAEGGISDFKKLWESFARAAQ